MRRFSLRALLFALALVLQTAAGGLGAAGTAFSAGHAGVSGHCERMDAPDKSLPARHGQHKHDCLSCQLCAGAASAVALGLDGWRIIVRETAAIALAPEARLLLASRVRLTQQARAPPASLA